MKRCCITITCILCPVIALAGGTKVRINKKAIVTRPGGSNGTVTISSPPGCVTGAHPIYIITVTKKGMVANSSSVMADGSFEIHVPAAPKDSVKLTFISADGKKKKIKIKIPETFSSFARSPAQNSPNQTRPPEYDDTAGLITLIDKAEVIITPSPPTP